MPREPNSWANLTNDTGRNVEQKPPNRRNIVHSTAYLQTDVNIHFISHIRWSTVQSVDKTRICLLLECHVDVVFVLLWFALEEFKPDPRMVRETIVYILGWFVTSSGHLYNIWKLWQFVLNLDVQSWPSLDVNMVFNIWTLHWLIFLDVMWKSWTTEAIGAAWKSIYNESMFDSEKTSLCTGFSLSGEREKVIVPIQAGHKHERSHSPV